MTSTPWDLAYVSIWAPTPESSGSIMRTVAPLVMSVSASVNSVLSLACAFWTMMSDDGRPAIERAFMMSGWSNST